VQLLALRVLGWPDAFPATDIGLLKAMGLAQARDAPQAIEMAESWRPWRSYAVIALWRALESGASSNPPPAAKPAPARKRGAAGPDRTPNVRRKTTAKES
jgi:AraC family transcriptional regulator of adaptative response / DNA-3-methyladenine glycosylase II